MSNDFDEVLRALAASPVPEPEEVSISELLRTVRLEPGDVLDDRYLLEEVLGEGGFGQVWRARRVMDNAQVAIKTLYGDAARNRKMRERFDLEILTLARLTHPGVVRLIDEGLDARTSLRFMAMELLKGRPLQRDTDLRTFLDYVIKMLDVLGHAHARGIIHRDLKPENIYALGHDAPFSIKLLDFGIARVNEGDGALDPTPGQRTRMLGTVPYMSPEQARGESICVGPASDLYAVGVMLYEALTGNVPFDGNPMTVLIKHANDPPPPMDLSRLPEASGLEGLIMALLAKRYEQRPESAADVQAALRTFIQSLDAPNPMQTLARVTHESVPTLDDALLAPGPALSAPATIAEDGPGGDGGLDDGDSQEAQAPDTGAEGWIEPTALLMAAQRPPTPLPNRHGAWHLRFLADHDPMGRQDLQRLLLERSRRHGAGLRVVVLRGATGSGRSRLARWLAEEVHARGTMRVLRASVTDRGSLDAAVYMAIYKHLRLPRLERQVLATRIEEALGHEAAEGLTRYLLEGSGHDGTRSTQAMTPQALHDLWTDTLAQAALRPWPRPALLWIDGGEGLDAVQAAQWMERWGRHRPQSEVMVVWSPEELPEQALRALEATPRVELLKLPPLAPGAWRCLAGELAPGLAPAALETLERWCQGNPGFIRELLQSWLREDALEETPEGMVPQESWLARPPLHFDEALLGQLEAWLEGCPDPEKADRALQLLALLGPTLPIGLAQRALADTGLTLDALAHQGWLSHRAGGYGPTLGFVSGPLREQLLKRARRHGELVALGHRAIDLRLQESLGALDRGDWEGAIFGAQLAWGLMDEHPELHHDMLRGLVLDALARVAFRQFERPRVEELARILGDLSRRPQLDDSDAQRLAALGQLWEAAAALLGNELDAVETHGLEALRLVGHLHEQWLQGVIHQRLAQGYLRQNALDQADQHLRLAIGHLHQALDGATTGTYSEALVARVLTDADLDLASLHTLRRRFNQAAMTLSEALGIQQLHQDRHGEAHARLQMTRVLRMEMERQGWRGPEVIEAIEQQRAAAAALLGALSDHRGHALLAWETAAFHEALERWAEAEASYAQARDLFRLAGDDYGAALCTNGQGEVARRAGQLQRAVEHYDRFCAQMRAMGQLLGVGVGLTNQGWVLLEAGQLTAAAAHFDDALLALVGSGADEEEANAHIGLAITLGRRALPGEAAEHLQRAAEIMGGEPVTDPDALGHLAHLADRPQGVTHTEAAWARRLVQGDPNRNP